MSLIRPLTRTTVSALVCASWLAACGSGGSGRADLPTEGAAAGESTVSNGAGGSGLADVATDSIAANDSASIAATGAPLGAARPDGAGTGTGASKPGGADTDTPAPPDSSDEPDAAPVESGEERKDRDGDGGTLAGPAGATPGSYGKLTFREEWNAPALDRDKWLTRMFHWTTPELDNWTIENGVLRMWTPRMANGQFLFENRAMNTDGKFSQRYGWFEMEAKLPRGRGLWPSFWLYAHNDHTRPEIDIMEAYGGGDQWWATADGRPIDYGATIWISPEDGRSGDLISHQRPGWNQDIRMTDLTAGFHKYGALWEPDGITFFFDGQPIGPKVRTIRLNQQMYLIIGLGTGNPGTFNAPTSETPTTSAHAFEINYVRAWALTQGTTTGGTHPDPSR